MNERPFSDLPDSLVEHAQDRASMAAWMDRAACGFTTREQEAVRRLVEYLVGPAKLTRKSARAAGLRALTLLWVMHPDRIPGSNGKPISLREMADGSGVTIRALTKLTDLIRRDFGLVNSSQVNRLRTHRKHVSRKKT